MNSCFECTKAWVDDKGVLCGYYHDVMYRIDDPHGKCDLMQEKDKGIDKDKGKEIKK